MPVYVSCYSLLGKVLIEQRNVSVNRQVNSASYDNRPYGLWHRLAWQLSVWMIVHVMHGLGMTIGD